MHARKSYLFKSKESIFMLPSTLTKDDDESLLESVLRVSTLSSSSSRALSTSCSNRMSATSSGRLSANLNIDDKEEFEQMEKEMSNEVKVIE